LGGRGGAPARRPAALPEDGPPVGLAGALSGIDWEVRMPLTSALQVSPCRGSLWQGGCLLMQPFGQWPCAAAGGLLQNSGQSLSRIPWSGRELDLPPARVLASEQTPPASAVPERQLGGNTGANTDKRQTRLAGRTSTRSRSGRQPHVTGQSSRTNFHLK